MTTGTVETLITHSGGFHADDLLAFAVLSSLHPGARLLRTRDAEVIAAAGERTVVFDVGFRYAPERHRYDHHQPDRPRRPEGLAYSSFGLIWRHFGRAYVALALSLDEAADRDTIELVHAELDAGLVRDIDAVDNGELAHGQDGLMHPLSLPNLLSAFRPAFDADTAGDEQAAFLEAAGVARSLMSALVRSTATGLRSRRAVQQAIAHRSEPDWIELSRSMDYLETVLSERAEEVLFVIAPSRDEWQLKSVNHSLDSFQPRKPLPAEWAGLRGPDLVAVTGVPDAAFCHAGRFVAIARSREGIVALLRQALAR